MNTKKILIATTVATLFMSTLSIAHDPSKHVAKKEKPNCEAMHEMDSSMMDMKDPVMQAMMKQCGKPEMKEHHKQKKQKSVCTEEHAKLGHCTLEVNADTTKDLKSKHSEHDYD